MDFKGSAKKAFTLIELLIVVAIIAILAAIAVPNFLEAQTRAKISRARSDMRTLATGLESYFVDNNRYPPMQRFATSYWVYVPWSLTSPISYVTEGTYFDVFRTPASIPNQFALTGDRNPNFSRRYLYVNNGELNAVVASGTRLFRGSTVFTPQPALTKGFWVLTSFGPDLDWGPFTAQRTGANLQIRYDPTNGTVSLGDVIRTQADPEGKGADTN